MLKGGNRGRECVMRQDLGGGDLCWDREDICIRRGWRGDLCWEGLFGGGSAKRRDWGNRMCARRDN